MKHESTGVKVGNVDFKHNLYYVKKNGDVMKFNKDSHKKSKVQKISRKDGHMYFVKKNGTVYECKMKTKVSKMKLRSKRR